MFLEKIHHVAIIASDYEKSKHTGELYELVKKKYSGKTILHIGDNRYSDRRSG